MWNADRPNDFARFTPVDMPDFLRWWEAQHTEAIALMFAGAYLDGTVGQHMEAIATANAPAWLQTVLRWQLAAQWAYQLGEPLSRQVMRSGIIPVWVPGMPAQLKITPAEIAEIPPQLRQGFVKSVAYGMDWIREISNDAREQTRQIIAIHQLKNRNPKDAIALLENVLRRDVIARQLGIAAVDVSDEAIQEWLQLASERVIGAIAQRAGTISITESARAQNEGILDAMELQGKTLCFVMPHRGTCEECQRLLDGRVFKIAVLRSNMFINFGQKKGAWVAAMPQHPRCRHSPMDVPVKFRKAVSTVEIPETGLLLQFYGFPGGQAAMESIGLKQSEPWLTPDGKMEQVATIS